MNPDPITDLLNKVSAIVKSGASSFPLLAQETGIPVRSLYDTVLQRRCQPSGKRALALHQWAERMTVRIAMMEDRSIQARYRSEFDKVQLRFPSTGKRD